MAASLSEAGFNAFLKRQYPNGPEDLTFAKSPFYGVIDKDSGFGGEDYQINPIIQGINGGNDFPTALANRSSHSYSRFRVTTVETHVIGTVDNKVIMLSNGSAHAIGRALERRTSEAYYELARAAAHQIFRNGGGSRGQGNSAWVVTSNSIVLTSVEDMVFFEPGMKLRSASTDGTSGAVRAGSVTVASINRPTRTITTTEANVQVAIGAVANSDYWFRDGDFGNSLSGVLAWTPATDPTATLFHGVNRTTDMDRLAGHRAAAVGGPIEEQVIEAEASGRTAGGDNYDCLVAHPKRSAAIKKSIHGKAWFGESERSNRMGAKRSDGRETRLSYPAFVFMGDNGPIKVLSDINCPLAYGFLTEMASWKLISVGKVPHFDTQNGNKLFVEPSADAKQFRLKAYWQLVNERPINTVVIPWS